MTITQKKVFEQGLILMWMGLILLSVLSLILEALGDKKVLDTDDFYREYLIDRTYFPGKKADWQYTNFRFEIKENDAIYFYITD